MKIRIVIIEDEFFTRQAIKKYVTTLGDPYEVCGEAGNGQEGLQLLRRVQPDIALVDITMPILNGIDMMQRARDEGIPTRMIVLTGYSEFSYARAAVHLGVGEYLLKPLRIEDLRHGLEHVMKGLSSAMRPSVDSLNVEALLREQLAEKLIQSGAGSADTDLLLEHLGFPRDGEAYYVALVQYYSETPRESPVLDKIAEAAHEALLKQGYWVISYPSDANGLCLVVCAPKGSALQPLRSALEPLGSAIHRALNVQLKVALSSPCPDLSMIHDAYLEAQSIQQYHLFCSYQHVALYTAQTTIQEPCALFGVQMRHDLIWLLHKGNAAEVTDFINRCFDQINPSQVSSDSIYLCVAEMLSAILEYSSGRGKSPESPPFGLHALFSINHTDSLRSFIVERALEAITRKAPDESAHLALVHRVNDYIEASIGNSNLRLEDIARANFISTQYLCSVYRQATQTTVGDYIFEARMNKARALIENGQRNVTAISEACGYVDPGYFGKCFRKKFGMTPRQYIEAHGH